MRSLTNIVVFCGSRIGVDPAAAEVTKELGTTMADRGIGLIYGGASIGLMGCIADTVLEHGGRVVGVLPEDLPNEIAHPGLTELHSVPDMHTRKRKMYELADAAIALPGGLGTLDEIFETATWTQLGMHSAPMPIAMLGANGYWDSLGQLLDRSLADGFVDSVWRDSITSVDSPVDALRHCADWLAPGE